MQRDSIVRRRSTRAITRKNKSQALVQLRMSCHGLLSAGPFTLASQEGLTTLTRRGLCFAIGIPKLPVASPLAYFGIVVGVARCIGDGGWWQ